MVVRSALAEKPLFRSLVAIAVAVMLLFIPCLPLVSFRGADRVTILDVGEGDGILIQDRFGCSVLVDGGPDERKIIAKLQSRRIRRLDLAVSSHPHSDHLTGLVAALREMPVGRVLDGGAGRGSGGAYEEFLRLVREKKIKRTIAREGQVITVSPDLWLEVLYAPRDLRGLPKNLNDCSVVMVAHLAGTRILLTGDIESTGQQTLLGLHPDLSCDVLKVPHQGARNAATPELIDSCKPRVGVISVEKDNPYGHPSARSVGLMRARGTSVFRTDRDGDIMLSVASGRIGVTTGSAKMR